MVRRTRGLVRVLLAVLVLATSLQFAPHAQARTFTVCPNGCNFATIAAALDAAGDGDEISIGDGTYAGGFVIEKNVTLRGAGRDRTTIQGTSRASVIRVRSGANVAIEGVTITGGGGSRIGANAIGGGGILNEGALTLFDSIVRDNTVAASGNRARLGGGIYSASSKLLTIRASEVAGNRASRGGGIFIGDGDAVIEFTTVSGNQSGSDGGGIHSEGSETLALENSEIIDNRAGGVGGGVSAGSALKLVDSTVAGNTASAGGGISSGSKLLRIEGSTIEGNVATAVAGFGGGINVGRGGLALGYSTVEDNRGLLGAGIFSAFSSGDVNLTGSTVAGNVAAADGGGIWNQSAEIDLNGSNVIDNRASKRGGGIFVRVPEPEVKLRNGSIVAGNQPDQCFPTTPKC